jgi:branched-chain amino acid transport system substrate-binding protein
MTRILPIILLVGSIAPLPLAAEKRYDPGASDQEIRIGNITSDTGRARAYGAVARAEAAYFHMVNDHGGINNRRITFISVDNQSDSSNSAGLTRELVERDGVLFIFSPIGTETNLAIRGYMNARGVPQLFVESSSAAFDDPVHFPWTMGFFATYRTEGLVYARYVLANRPGARIAILHGDDDVGREFAGGVRDGLGDRASSMIVREAIRQGSVASVNPLIKELKASNADVFLNLSVGPGATEAIRAAYDLDWHPLQFIPNASLSVAAFLDPAGLEKAAGIIANARSKGYLGPEARSDPDVRDFLEWMAKYNPQANPRDQDNLAGYERAETLVAVLRKCGDDLTRANVMRQATELDLQVGMLRPGIRIRTSRNDYQPIKELFLIRFDGKRWIPLRDTTGDPKKGP